MKHIISSFSVTVIVDGKSYSITSDRTEYREAITAARNQDWGTLSKLLGLDPLVDKLRTYGGHFDDSQKYFIRRRDGKFWGAPKQGLSDTPHPYFPSQIKDVIGPHDKVELIRAS